MKYQSLILGGGCFWCTEAVFQQLRGVESTVCGYAGGKATDASYDQVCSGRTNHAEALKINYLPEQVTLATLLEVFFQIAHDPSQLDRQGNDIGRQYRSVLFYHDSDEKAQLNDFIRQAVASGQLDSAIATTLEPLDAFYPAEDYHQDYAASHPLQPYIFCVTKPKVDKLKAKRPDLLKRQGDTTS